MDGSVQSREYIPRLIAWEVTRSCLLKCKHCRASAKSEEYSGELSTEEIYRSFDSIARHYNPIIIITGGDPMLRSDLLEIISYGNARGLRMVMAPCGQLLTEKAMRDLKEAGIRRVSFSIDGSCEAGHDSFRGVKGSFRNIMDGMEYARRVGMEFQINTTVSKDNLTDLPEILKLAVREGAVAFHPFLLVPTGKAKTLLDRELTPEQYEKVLGWVYKKKKQIEIEFKPTCAPHYYRISSQMGEKARGKGCMGGHSFAFISHRGKVQICGFLDVEAGDLRKSGYNFAEIWQGSPLFREIREVDNYEGKCGSCSYRRICGGCRARAYGVSGSYLAEEPYCSYR